MKEIHRADVGMRSPLRLRKRVWDSRHSAASSRPEQSGPVRSATGIYPCRPDRSRLDVSPGRATGLLAVDRDSQKLKPLRSEPERTRPVYFPGSEAYDACDRDACLHKPSSSRADKNSSCRFANSVAPGADELGMVDGYKEDQYRDLYMRNLSQFNETLSCGESTCMKFQWDVLLAGKAVNANASFDLRHGFNDAMRISTRSERGPTLFYPTSTEEHSYSQSKEKLESGVCKERDKPFSYNLRSNPSLDGYFGGLCKEGTSDPSDRHEKNRRELPRGDVGYFYGHGQKMSSDSSPIADFKSPMKEPALTRNLNTGVMTGDCKCNEALRSEVDALSSQFPHKNMVVSRPRPSIIDSIGDRIEGADSSLHHGLRDSRMAWDRYSYLHGQSLDVTGASCTLQQDESRIAHLCNRGKSYLTETLQFPEDYGVELPFETTSLQARKEVYVGNENMRWENDYGFKGDGHPVIFQDGLTSRSQSENEEGIYDIKHWSQQMLTDEELNMHDQSETKMRENRAIDLRLITQNRTPKVSQEWDGYNEALGCVEQQWIDHDIKQLSTPNSSELEYSPNCGVDFDLSFPSPRVSVKERLGIPIKPSSRDIMKRLGPRRKANLISPWLKYHITRDSSRGNFENLNGRLPAGRNDSLKSKVKRKEKDPPEDSEEFKQRIHSAFLKHYKSLNEIPSQRRKYMMQGNGVVKCCVCGRNFEGSLSLTTHAFNSHMVGMRADHLGLHRALCVLMGWEYEGAPNGTWVMRKLPDAELMSLKEDLLIWPPVVVFHNCSIANNCSERRRFISIEELGAIVRGMGISGITKLSHGRPANQSVMVVSFQGTLSGLQEAERLEKFYAATEHGRADFQKLSGSGSGSAIGNKAREPITDTISDVLYGYLGIAEDLEKLDFEIRRRSVLKSKNEIRAIVNATLSAN